jgi:hypothetical protein
VDHSGKIWIVETVCVAEAFVRDEFEKFAAEGVAFPAGEIRERHFEATTHPRIHVMHLACEAVWGKPFVHRVCVDERFVDALGRRAQDAMEADGVSGRIRVRAHVRSFVSLWIGLKLVKPSYQRRTTGAVEDNQSKERFEFSKVVSG